MTDEKLIQENNSSQIVQPTAIAGPVSNEDKHLEIIRLQTEEAKNPASYETYEYQVSESDSSIKMFAARRLGTKHVLEKIPCQDYCLVKSDNNCTILTDADGVSSCEHSDIGSRLACEAVIKTVTMASKTCKDETQFVNRVLSISFREKMVSAWIKLVMEEINKEKSISPAEQTKEFSKYGSTIMFSVITKNWIVVGNLGDGQILVFNDAYGVKLRVHAPKDSSRVRCLANERCAREDFIVAKYPRKCFNGVLLSTDGIYESMDKNTHFFEYAIQMKTRFLERQPHEPYQAFCYKEAEEPYKDFSAMRTQDDCSIALAIDETPVETKYDEIINSISTKAEAAFLKRWAPSCISVYAKRGDSYADILVSKQNSMIAVPELKNAIVDMPVYTWNEKDYVYTVYAASDAITFEFMHSTGLLRRDRHDPEKSEEYILNVLYSLKDLKIELQSLGYVLNASAIFNLLFDGKNIYIRREAIQKREDENQPVFPDNFERYFNHILGILETEEWTRPVFDIGYIDRGIKYYITSKNDEELGQLTRENKLVKIKNTSPYSWKLKNDRLIAPGETLQLDGRIEILVIGSHEEENVKFRYISKEQL